MKVLKDVGIDGGVVRVERWADGETLIGFWTDSVYGRLTAAKARDLAAALTEAADTIEFALIVCVDPEGDAWAAEQTRLAQARIDAIARAEVIKDEPFDAHEVRLAMIQLTAATGNIIAPGRLAS